MIEVDPRSIAPSQNFLKEKTVRFILECFQADELDRLPPEPIVRRNAQGMLVAIDGHNLLAVRAYRGEKQAVHVADSMLDGLPRGGAATAVRNQDLANKFEACLEERDRVAALGVRSFQDLVTKYQDIFEEIR